MLKLALLGGQPHIKEKMEWGSFWPPIDDTTGEKLKELYLSRDWSFNSKIEQEFAQSFAEYHGAKYGIFMANGTVTLQCALGACGIGPGDEVIVPSLTWIATANAVHYVGATPVFVDIDKDTLCLDAEKVSQAINENTKAIIPVHLFGSMADIDKILMLAKQNNLKVIEDCAHMHGGMWDGKGVGSQSDVGSFSFQQSKTMASGEGGICITNDPVLAEDIFRIKHIGYAPGQAQGRAQNSPREGLLCHNFRATGFQALILNEQLKGLSAHLERCHSSVQYLENRLQKSTDIRFQKQGRKATTQGYFGWVMFLDSPSYADISLDIFAKAFEAEGVPIYPTWGPVFQFVLFNLRKDAYRIDQGRSPVAEELSKHTLYLLHAYLGLDIDSIEMIAEAIEKVLKNCDQLREYERELAS